MPGPMSVPNGHPEVAAKFSNSDGDVWYVRIGDMTGEQRAYLASHHRLDTGKTAKKKAGGAP